MTDLKQRTCAVKIIVDADACPKTVLTICSELAAGYGVSVVTVASFAHRIDSADHVVVGDASQETDIRIMNLVEKGDVVVTQDWALAAVVLGKGGKAVSPGGRIYHPEFAPFLLEEREIKVRFRRTGGRTKGPAKRTRADDLRFRKALTFLLEQKPPVP